MNNRVEIDHLIREGSGPELLGYEGITPEVHRYPTPRKGLRGPSISNFIVADGRKSDKDPKIVLTTAYDERADEFTKTQVGVIAVSRQALVVMGEQEWISIDHANPLKTRGDKPPLIDTLRAFSGKYDTASRHLIETVHKLVNLEDGGNEIEVAGFSQGAARAVSIDGVIARGETPVPLSVAYLDMIDPVNAFGGRSIFNKLGRLTSLRTVEAALIARYLEENSSIGHGEVVPFEYGPPENALIMKYLRQRQGFHTLVSGAGLRKGIDKPLIKLATNPATREATLKTQMNFFYAEQSTVALESDIVPTVEALQALGVDANAIALFDPQGEIMAHHFPKSLLRLARFNRAVKADRDEHYGMDQRAA